MRCRLWVAALVVGISGIAGGDATAPIGGVTPVRAKAMGKFNYGEALQKSIWFYDAQRSGKLPAENRVSWRGDSGLSDGADNKVDLTGGWYDAGDHVKFGLPMAASATMLAWGVVDYREAYEKSGQLGFMLANLKWAADYFVKCHTGPEEFYGQVGEGNLDHSWWGPAEAMPMARKSFKITAEKPGSELAGETAAALAAAAMAFRKSDAAYADLLLKHARELYAFAEKRQGKYDAAIPDVANFYRSFSGFTDELVWGAIWLHRATGEKTYLEKAETLYDKLNLENGTKLRNYKWTISWDDKCYGCYVLLAKLTGKQMYKEDAERWLDYWTAGVNGQKVKYTPGGLAWLDQWGSLRYAANTAFVALVYSDGLADKEKAARYHDFAVRQINYCLGENPGKRSFVCGYGEKPPAAPHHRTAHGSWTNSMQSPEQSRHVLYGALVGGPDAGDGYKDDRGNYVNNEVACDYNAAFTGALARLYQEFGGEALADFPAREKAGEEFVVEACVNAADKGFTEIRALLFNRSAWPARAPRKIAYRYFMDLSEVIAGGTAVKDLKVTMNYHEKGKISAIQPWDEKKNLYYLEIAFDGDGPTPAGQSECRREAQFRVALPGNKREGWDASNDWSFTGIGSNGQLKKAGNIVVYEDGKRVWGEEPK